MKQTIVINDKITWVVADNFSVPTEEQLHRPTEWEQPDEPEVIIPDNLVERILKSNPKRQIDWEPHYDPKKHGSNSSEFEWEGVGTVAVAILQAVGAILMLFVAGFTQGFTEGICS